MRRALLALAALAALLALGGLSSCQKKTLTETGEANALQNQLKRDPTEVPDLGKEVNPLVKALEVPRVALAALHDDFKKIGPLQGYEYVGGSDSLKGDKIPGGQMHVSDMIVQYYQVNGNSGDVTDPNFRQTSIETYLKDPKFPLPVIEEKSPEELAAETKAIQAKEAGAAWQEALSVALDPAGDWRSFEEVREGQDKNENVVKHDEKYYKNIFIQADPDPKAVFAGLVIIQEYNGGELESKYEQPYRYDKALGEMTLISDEGSPLLTLQLMQMAGERDILYVKKQSEFIYTVYERVGSSGRTQTEEEKEREKRNFESRGGGTAHGGKGGGAAGGSGKEGK